MKYCRNCHILYSSFAAACPKCGALTKREQPDEGAEQGPDPSARPLRDWLWLVIGLPVLIAVIYFAAKLLSSH